MKLLQFKHSRLVFGSIAFILGIVFCLLPMLPFGYLFLFISCLLLADKIPVFKKLLERIKAKDKKNRLEKVENKIKHLFGEDLPDTKETGAGSEKDP